MRLLPHSGMRLLPHSADAISRSIPLPGRAVLLHIPSGWRSHCWYQRPALHTSCIRSCPATQGPRYAPVYACCLRLLSTPAVSALIATQGPALMQHSASSVWWLHAVNEGGIWFSLALIRTCVCPNAGGRGFHHDGKPQPWWPQRRLWHQIQHLQWRYGAVSFTVSLATSTCVRIESGLAAGFTRHMLTFTGNSYW